MTLRLSAEVTEDDFAHVFTGFACVPSQEFFLRQALSISAEQIQRAAFLREEFATSGAMRWPWSSEAAIVSTVQVHAL